MNRIAVGTVQFGLPYGITNIAGQVSRLEARALLKLAAVNGIDTLDTAIAYGDSEACLGEIGTQGFKVVTKLPAVPSECIDVGVWVRQQVIASLARLNVSSVYGLLLHRPEQLLGAFGASLYQALQELKEIGQVQKIGFSIYSPSELDALLPQFRMDLVQAPFNLIDRRLADSGWLCRLADRGIELHVRSIFLQGLLLMPAGSRPSRFDPWSSLWSRWDRWLAQEGISPLQACLRFALGFQEINKVVIGMESARHLKEILDSSDGPALVAPSDFSESDVNLINPANW